MYMVTFGLTFNQPYYYKIQSKDEVKVILHSTFFLIAWSIPTIGVLN